MNLAKKILHKLDGLHYPQEYLCFARETFPEPARVYIVTGNRIFTDITTRHILAGYSPVIFALHSLRQTGFGLPSVITVILSHNALEPNDIFGEKDAIARLTLKKIYRQDVANDTIGYYEAIHGSHRFVPAFHRFIAGINNRLFNNKPGNVFLRGNLYKQVQIAYAVPRTVSTITVGNGQLFNLFPTDLHGPAGGDYYIISLRHAGLACRQVMEAGHLCIAQADAHACKTVYSLGKNHMREPRPKEHFPFGTTLTPVFQLPLPRFARSYRELELLHSCTLGIHNLLLFKIVSEQQASPGTLAHIHNSYATWRDNNRLEGNYLLR